MKEFVKKVVRMRKAMVRRGCSKKNAMRVHKAIDRFEKYFDFYPNASDGALKRFCQRHKEDLLALMPGRGSSSYEKLNKELNQYLNA